MKFEELESLWAGQSPSPAFSPQVSMETLQRAVRPELKRRQRLLRYGFFVVIFGLVVGPLLAVVNYRHALPAHPIWHWVSLGLNLAMLLIWLMHFVRQLRRQRELLQQSAAHVRALTAASLASVESEIRDYRWILWQLPFVLNLQLVTLALNFPVPEVGWLPFAGRAAFAVGLPLLMLAVMWRHGRINLQPQRARLQKLQRELA